jgi:hypothetical protein
MTAVTGGGAYRGYGSGDGSDSARGYGIVLSGRRQICDEDDIVLLMRRWRARLEAIWRGFEPETAQMDSWIFIPGMDRLTILSVG